MNKRILVVTPTLGRRTSLRGTISSVRQFGGDSVDHVIVGPKSIAELVARDYSDVIFYPEPDGCRSLYQALNSVVQKIGKDYEFFAYLNDDDFWTEDMVQLIDLVLSNRYDLVYGKTRFVNPEGMTIGLQTCSDQFDSFVQLLRSNVVLFTQQAAIVRASLFYELGCFDDSYRLIADTKFWAMLSKRKSIKYKYFNRYCAGYTIQQGQLSSNKELQSSERLRLFEELNISPLRFSFALLLFRLYNFHLYLTRLFSKGNYKR